MRGKKAKALRRVVYGQGMERQHTYGPGLIMRGGKVCSKCARTHVITSARRQYQDSKHSK